MLFFLTDFTESNNILYFCIVRTTLEVCLSPLAFLPFTKKKSSGNTGLKICDLTQ